MRCTLRPCSLANGKVVVARYVDDGHRNAISLETLPQLDPRSILQVDVEDDASRALEIGVTFESPRGRKQDGFVSVLPQQPLNALQHPRVIIDY
jgi:hypothetical protein